MKNTFEYNEKLGTIQFMMPEQIKLEYLKTRGKSGKKKGSIPSG